MKYEDYKDYIEKIVRTPTAGPFFISEIWETTDKIFGEKMNKALLYFLGKNGLSKTKMNIEKKDFESFRIIDSDDTRKRFIKNVFGE